MSNFDPGDRDVLIIMADNRPFDQLAGKVDFEAALFRAMARTTMEGEKWGLAFFGQEQVAGLAYMHPVWLTMSLAAAAMTLRKYDHISLVTMDHDMMIMDDSPVAQHVNRVLRAWNLAHNAKESASARVFMIMVSEKSNRVNAGLQIIPPRVGTRLEAEGEGLEAAKRKLWGNSVTAADYKRAISKELDSLVPRNATSDFLHDRRIFLESPFRDLVLHSREQLGALILGFASTVGSLPFRTTGTWEFSGNMRDFRMDNLAHRTVQNMPYGTTAWGNLGFEQGFCTILPVFSSVKGVLAILLGEAGFMAFSADPAATTLPFSVHVYNPRFKGTLPSHMFLPFQAHRDTVVGTRDHPPFWVSAAPKQVTVGLYCQVKNPMGASSPKGVAALLTREPWVQGVPKAFFERLQEQTVRLFDRKPSPSEVEMEPALDQEVEETQKTFHIHCEGLGRVDEALEGADMIIGHLPEGRDGQYFGITSMPSHATGMTFATTCKIEEGTKLFFEDPQVQIPVGQQAFQGGFQGFSEDRQPKDCSKPVWLKTGSLEVPAFLTMVADWLQATGKLDSGKDVFLTGFSAGTGVALLLEGAIKGRYPQAVVRLRIAAPAFNWTLLAKRFPGERDARILHWVHDAQCLMFHKSNKEWIPWFIKTFEAQGVSFLAVDSPKGELHMDVMGKGGHGYSRLLLDMDSWFMSGLHPVSYLFQKGLQWKPSVENTMALLDLLEFKEPPPIQFGELGVWSQDEEMTWADAAAGGFVAYLRNCMISRWTADAHAVYSHLVKPELDRAARDISELLGGIQPNHPYGVGMQFVPVGPGLAAIVFYVDTEVPGDWAKFERDGRSAHRGLAAGDLLWITASLDPTGKGDTKVVLEGYANVVQVEARKRMEVTAFAVLMQATTQTQSHPWYEALRAQQEAGVTLSLHTQSAQNKVLKGTLDRLGKYRGSVVKFPFDLMEGADPSVIAHLKGRPTMSNGMVGGVPSFTAVGDRPVGQGHKGCPWRHWANELRIMFHLAKHGKQNEWRCTPAYQVLIQSVEYWRLENLLMEAARDPESTLLSVVHLIWTLAVAGKKITEGMGVGGSGKTYSVALVVAMVVILVNTTLPLGHPPPQGVPLCAQSPNSAIGCCGNRDTPRPLASGGAPLIASPVCTPTPR